MVLAAYLHRPRQFRAFLYRKLEPLKIVRWGNCWLTGYHNFGVNEEPRARCWGCGLKSVGRSW